MQMLGSADQENKLILYSHSAIDDIVSLGDVELAHEVCQRVLGVHLHIPWASIAISDKEN